MTAPTPEEFERHLHKGPTLTEFLLARIAEDEQPTWRLVPYGCPPGCCAPAGWVGSECRYCDAAPVFGGTVEAITSSAVEHAEIIHGRSRVLAQCAAYRSLVEEHPPTDPFNHEGDRWCRRCLSREDDTGYPDEWVQASYPCPTLRALATIWADHADYDERWRT